MPFLGVLTSTSKRADVEDEVSGGIVDGHDSAQALSSAVQLTIKTFV